MTYVEKMGNKIWMESPEGCKKIIDQMIADTKRGCVHAMNEWCDEQDENMIHSFTEIGLYKAVSRAEPKEE